MSFYASVTAYLRELNTVALIVRLMTAAFCGGLIGLCRGRQQHAAGLRTHVLVCIGAASVMIANQYIVTYFNPGGDPARMGAQVVSGIGFLGAGTIIVTGRDHIRGLTTAAGLWASACMGLAAGIGYLELAWLMCLLLYTVLILLNHLDSRFLKTASYITLYIEFDSSLHFSCILSQLRAIGFHVSELDQIKTTATDLSAMRLSLRYNAHHGTMPNVTDHLLNIPGVLFVEDL